MSKLCDRVNRAKHLTKLDLKHGYYHIRVKEGDQCKKPCALGMDYTSTW